MLVNKRKTYAKSQYIYKKYRIVYEYINNNNYYNCLTRKLIVIAKRTI